MSRKRKTDAHAKLRALLIRLFSALCFGLTEPVFGYALPPKGAKMKGNSRPVPFTITIKDLQEDPEKLSLLMMLNREWGLYFRPNGGGNTDAEIIRRNAVFAEMDDRPVDEQIEMFSNGPLPPSILIVTKRSAHCYYLIEGDCSEQDWRDITNRVIAFFNSDPSIKNPSRLMRLPGFDHLSIEDDGALRRKPVECVLVEPDRRYTVEHLKAAFPAVPRSKRTEARRQEGPVGEGERNARLFRLGCYYRNLGCEEDEIVAQLMIDNRKLCRPMLDQEEVEEIARNACRYAKGVGFHTTQVGNAKRFVSRHGDRLRFCRAWNVWLIWDGKQWPIDETGEVVRLAIETVLSIYEEAAREKDPARREQLARWAVRSETEDQIKSMIALARSEPGIAVTPDHLDSDPLLLNLENGTFDFRSGQLREHRSQDLITKIAPVAYDPEANCPIFDSFLARIFDGDAELISYVQAGSGYTLSGLTGEQIMFICYGHGANGKSTFFELMRMMLGDYALRTPTETLMVKRGGGGIPNDVARLKGARLVTAVEGEEGQRLAESFIKQVTGGDTITARFMRAEFFEFRPEFKLWFATNHKPAISDTGHAMWRRIRLIPFTVTIPEEQQDKELADKLRAELPGILRWAIEGAMAWQKHGLGMPKAVCDATAEYRKEMDSFGEFLEERCVEGPKERVPKGKLYEAYNEWCKSHGAHPLGRSRFTNRLKERGVTERKSGNHLWVGVGLKPIKYNASNFLADEYDIAGYDDVAEDAALQL